MKQAERITTYPGREKWKDVTFNLIGVLIFLTLLYGCIWEITEYVA